MTDKEALKLALEALELLTGAWQTFDALDYGDNAITAIKEALAEHAMRETQRLGQEIEQEPVACKTLSLEIKLPVGFMNAGVSVNNFFTADTNDSKNWDTIKFPLPKGNWVIKSVKENIVTLVNEAPLPVQPEQEPVAIKRMKEWIEYLKRKSDFGQHMKIPSEMSAGTCWELAIELEQFINTHPPQRKPLTNGEIYTAYITATNQTLRATDERLAFAFARAIEAAHGIKE